MPMETLLAFAAAAALMIAIPGPNVAVIVANSIGYGTRYGMVSVAGVIVGGALQLYLTVFGLAALVAVVAEVLEWVRWAGVIYLLYLGLRAWLKPPEDLTAIGAQPRSVRGLFWRGLLLSVANPKTLLFYMAFLPQFVRPEGDVTGQLFVLSAVYIAVAIVGYARLRSRITGTFLIGGGIGLALSRS